MHDIELFAGRAQLIYLEFDEHRLVIANLHNFFPSPDDAREVVSHLLHVTNSAKEDPTAVSFIMLGDFNISAAPVLHTDLIAEHIPHDPLEPDVIVHDGQHPHIPLPPPSANFSTWKPLFDDLTEIIQDKPSRYG